MEKDQVNIFLVEDKTSYPDAAAADIFHLKLAAEPVISNSDIVAYDWATHRVELTPGAMESLNKLDVPVNGGRSFVLCAGLARIYLGAFWTTLSSGTSEGVVIQVPPGDDETINIQLGYPGESFFRGNDPRSDSRIREALQNTGKLRA